MYETRTDEGNGGTRTRLLAEGWEPIAFQLVAKPSAIQTPGQPPGVVLTAVWGYRRQVLEVGNG